jgi:hypothetical protein
VAAPAVNENAQFCTERKTIAHEECGWKDGDSGELGIERNFVQQKPRIDLTPTGLLMEAIAQVYAFYSLFC